MSQVMTSIANGKFLADTAVGLYQNILSILSGRVITHKLSSNSTLSAVVSCNVWTCPLVMANKFFARVQPVKRTVRHPSSTLRRRLILRAKMAVWILLAYCRDDMLTPDKALDREIRRPNTLLYCAKRDIQSSHGRHIRRPL